MAQRHDNRSPGSCIFRIAVKRAACDVELADGTHVARNEPVGELPCWTDRMPPVPHTGPDLAWTLDARRRLRESLTELAQFVEREPGLRAVRAFHGELPHDLRDSHRASLAPQQLGIEIVALARASMLRLSFARAEDKHVAFWISRETLLRKYGPHHQSEDHPDSACA